MTTSLELTRSQILAFRRRATALDERLPRGRRALRRAAGSLPLPGIDRPIDIRWDHG